MMLGPEERFIALGLFGWHLLCCRQTCEHHGHEGENGKGDFDFGLHSLILVVLCSSLLGAAKIRVREGSLQYIEPIFAGYSGKYFHNIF
jgi:hypothetical protein